jgi:uncharacterized protein YecE (DUF72 family)
LAVDKIFIGTSGYSYSHWENGVFYPPHLSKTKQLEHYTQFLGTVELNVTFYRLPQLKAFLSWHQRTPAHFVFAVKGSRFITHVKRLKDPQEALKRFFDRAVALKEKLGVVLWQLPPRFKYDLKRFQNFLKALETWKAYRHAFEFRHSSWFCNEVYEMVRTHNMTVCYADWPGLEIQLPDIFTFIYIRRHGPTTERVYTGCYLPQELEKDASFIKGQIEKGRDVFIYFNNDAFGYAIKNALELKKLLPKEMG